MKLSDYFDSQLVWMTIRISGEVLLKDMEAFAKEMNSVKWVIGHEVSQKLVRHSHMVIAVEEDFTDYIWKDKIRKHFKVSHQEFSKSRVRSSHWRAIQYCIKDGEYLFKGFSIETMLKIKKQSTKKFNRVDFGEAMIKNENLFYQGNIHFREFGRNFHKIKLQFGQRPNSRSATSYLEFHRQKVDLVLAEKWIDDIIDHIIYSLEELTLKNGPH